MPSQAAACGTIRKKYAATLQPTANTRRKILQTEVANASIIFTILKKQMQGIQLTKSFSRTQKKYLITLNLQVRCKHVIKFQTKMQKTYLKKTTNEKEMHLDLGTKIITKINVAAQLRSMRPAPNNAKDTLLLRTNSKH